MQTFAQKKLTYQINPLSVPYSGPPNNVIFILDSNLEILLWIMGLMKYFMTFLKPNGYVIILKNWI